ncbi:MAG TPA: lipopolysaccharide kinase InaA family protein, partial [Phycisphaerae bacterium]|nr:lipopolysaccharide kinase InaA family protein [Phycisphaerae bacterium]
MSTSAVAGNLRAVDSAKVRSADGEAAALLAGHLEAICFPQRAGWHRVKRNASRTVYRGVVDGQEVYVKHFHPRSLAHRIGRRVGASGALREMRWAKDLAARGVATPAVLGAVCCRGIEWVATRAVAPATAADVWHARQLQRGGAHRKAIQRGILALAEMVGRMHAAGVLHRDLHCGNILVRDGTDPPELVLMDLHRVRRGRRLSRRARAANLAQLLHDRYDFTTRTERLRFLKHYLRAGGAEGTLRGWQLLIEHFAER